MMNACRLLCMVAFCSIPYDGRWSSMMIYPMIRRRVLPLLAHLRPPLTQCIFANSFYVSNHARAPAFRSATNYRTQIETPAVISLIPCTVIREGMLQHRLAGGVIVSSAPLCALLVADDARCCRSTVNAVSPPSMQQNVAPLTLFLFNDYFYSQSRHRVRF